MKSINQSINFKAHIRIFFLPDLALEFEGLKAKAVCLILLFHCGATNLLKPVARSPPPPPGGARAKVATLAAIRLDI